MNSYEQNFILNNEFVIMLSFNEKRTVDLRQHSEKIKE